MRAYKGFSELSVLVECSTGSTPTVATLKRYIDLLKAFGYSHLYLGLTDAYKLEGEPYFNFGRGGYSTEQLREIDEYADKRGIELRAGVQVLGHMGFMQQHDCYVDLFDNDAIFMVGKKEVYEFIDKIFATISSSIRSRVIHIGMDETFNLGLGRYLEENGYTDRRTLLLQHLQQVVQIAEKYSYSCEIWSDMFFHEMEESDMQSVEVVRKKIPKGVKLAHWRYHKRENGVLEQEIAMHKAMCDEVILAGCAWKSMGLAPNNKYSIELAEQQMQVCRQAGVEHYMVTLWSNAGGHCSIYSVLPTLFAIAEMATGKKMENINKDKFKEIVGVEFDEFMLLDNLNNPFYKELDGKNARCQWGLLSDIFLGSHDLYLSLESNDAYQALARRYAEVKAGDYQLLFKCFSLYASVLSIKMNLGVKVRTAYKAKDKEKLRTYVSHDIPKLIENMREFIRHFEAYWLTENMPFGLEVHHLFYGGQLQRWSYIAKRIRKHLEDALPIEEMEREELLPEENSQTDEDRFCDVGYHGLVSRCEMFEYQSRVPHKSY